MYILVFRDGQQNHDVLKHLLQQYLTNVLLFESFIW